MVNNVSDNTLCLQLTVNTTDIATYSMHNMYASK